MISHPHPRAECPICHAMESMSEDERRPRATTTRDPFRFSEDDVLDAHLALKSIDRIPSEWRA